MSEKPRRPIVYVSAIAVEDIPVYHACPGAPAVRIVLPGGVIACEECWWNQYTRPASLVAREYPEHFVASRVRILRAGLVFFDGGEPLLHDWILDAAKNLKKTLAGSEAYVGVKTTGLVDPGIVEEAAKVFDYIGLEYHGARDPRVLARKAFVENLETLAEKARSLEILFLFDGSKRAETGLHDLSSRLPRRIGFHIILLRNDTLAEDRGYRVASRLRGRGVNVYLYGDNSFVTTDTLCPDCGSVIVSRKPWGVKINGTVAEDGSTKCSSCGREHKWLIGCRKPRRHNIHREHVIY